MSLQTCHCGWSNITSYQGLRTHQGKMGCTPRGMRIPESEQFRYLPKLTYLGPQLKLEEPVMGIFSPLKPDATDSSSDVSLQVCHCGWSSITSYHGLRTHQGMMGCTPRGMRIPESKQYFFKNEWEESHQKDSSRAITSAPVKEETVLVSPNLITQTNPATQAAVAELFKSLFESQEQLVQMSANLEKTYRVFDVTSDAQPILMPASQVITQMTPAAAETSVVETNKSLFETPQHSHQITTGSNRARRTLNFSTVAQQGGELWELPTTTAQAAVICPKEEADEKEKERKAQKQLKARQDRMRADLLQKLHFREHKVAEVRSSVMACKGSLDAEWLEIDNVFSEVMRIVQDARQKALQPLEERRLKVKKEGQDLVQKLQREIDAVKKTIDKLDKNSDLQVSPPTALNESEDWRNVSVDTSLSFGTLRRNSSAMMKQIQHKLEKLSSLELERIPTFAVDVKLDPNTAHQCLIISDDGKKVRDGGKKSEVPDAPERFNAFGSVLGLNSLTSGKSYWEVEVSNKTGWDLGVARHDANRKGNLLLNPDSGYWVTVHYEDKKYAALTAPPISLSLKEKPQKVGVFVDYEEGLVSFYDVTTRSHIYSFTECAFGNEIFPYFSPHLNQNGRNTDPLVISAVQKQ